jgi:hypothetical protein
MEVDNITLSDVLPEDLQANESLTKFEGNLSEVTPKLAKSYLEVESKMGSMTQEHEKALNELRESSVRIPGEDADDNARREFFTKLGCPKTLDDYSDVVVEGLPKDFQQKKEATEEIRKACHEAGVPDSQYKAVMEALYKKQLVDLDNFVTKSKALEEETVAQLTKKWGGEDKFKEKVELGKRLVEHYGGGDEKLKDFLVDTRLGSYAPLVKMFGDIASDIMSEETTFTGEAVKAKNKNEVERSKTTGEVVLTYDKSPELE